MNLVPKQGYEDKRSVRQVDYILGIVKGSLKHHSWAPAIDVIFALDQMSTVAQLMEMLEREMLQPESENGSAAEDKPRASGPPGADGKPVQDTSANRRAGRKISLQTYELDTSKPERGAFAAAVLDFMAQCTDVTFPGEVELQQTYPATFGIQAVGASHFNMQVPKDLRSSGGMGSTASTLNLKGEVGEGGTRSTRDLFGPGVVDPKGQNKKFQSVKSSPALTSLAQRSDRGGPGVSCPRRECNGQRTWLLLEYKRVIPVIIGAILRYKTAKDELQNRIFGSGVQLLSFYCLASRDGWQAAPLMRQVQQCILDRNALGLDALICAYHDAGKQPETGEVRSRWAILGCRGGIPVRKLVQDDEGTLTVVCGILIEICRDQNVLKLVHQRGGVERVLFTLAAFPQFYKHAECALRLINQTSRMAHLDAYVSVETLSKTVTNILQFLAKTHDSEIISTGAMNKAAQHMKEAKKAKAKEDRTKRELAEKAGIAPAKSKRLGSPHRRSPAKASRPKKSKGGKYGKMELAHVPLRVQVYRSASALFASLSLAHTHAEMLVTIGAVEGLVAMHSQASMDRQVLVHTTDALTRLLNINNAFELLDACSGVQTIANSMIQMVEEHQSLSVKVEPTAKRRPTSKSKRPTTATADDRSHPPTDSPNQPTDSPNQPTENTTENTTENDSPELNKLDEPTAITATTDDISNEPPQLVQDQHASHTVDGRERGKLHGGYVRSSLHFAAKIGAYEMETERLVKAVIMVTREGACAADGISGAVLGRPSSAGPVRHRLNTQGAAKKRPMTAGAAAPSARSDSGGKRGGNDSTPGQRVWEDGCATLHSLVQCKANGKFVVKHAGIECVTMALRQYDGVKSVMEPATKCLSRVACSSNEVATAIDASGVTTYLLSLLQKYFMYPTFTQHAILYLSRLQFGLLQVEAMAPVIAAMRHQKKHVNVQREGSLVLSNILKSQSQKQSRKTRRETGTTTTGSTGTAAAIEGEAAGERPVLSQSSSAPEAGKAEPAEDTYSDASSDDAYSEDEEHSPTEPTEGVVAQLVRVKGIASLLNAHDSYVTSYADTVHRGLAKQTVAKLKGRKGSVAAIYQRKKLQLDVDRMAQRRRSLVIAEEAKSNDQENAAEDDDDDDDEEEDEEDEEDAGSENDEEDELDGSVELVGAEDDPMAVGAALKKRRRQTRVKPDQTLVQLREQQQMMDKLRDEVISQSVITIQSMFRLRLARVSAVIQAVTHENAPHRASVTSEAARALALLMLQDKNTLVNIAASTRDESPDEIVRYVLAVLTNKESYAKELVSGLTAQV
jgi:hypothetical protein